MKSKYNPFKMKLPIILGIIGIVLAAYAIYYAKTCHGMFCGIDAIFFIIPSLPLLYALKTIGLYNLFVSLFQMDNNIQSVLALCLINGGSLFLFGWSLQLLLIKFKKHKVWVYAILVASIIAFLYYLMYGSMSKPIL